MTNGRGYSATEVAKMLDLPPARVRAYVRDGLVQPEKGEDGEPRFGFQDLLLLRTAEGLVTERLSPRRVRRALRKLRDRLPGERPLTAVQISSDGNRVLVRDGDSTWHAESGQMMLEFERGRRDSEQAPEPPLSPLHPDRDRASSVANAAPEGSKDSQGSKDSKDPPASPDAGPPSSPDADGLYELGCDLEDTEPAKAVDAYVRALTLDPNHGGAHTNLGRLLHEAGETAAAEAHYRLALAARADDALAAFNLGVLLDDLGRMDDAAELYRQALRADPRNADAHYNLARICERQGRRAEALRHLRTYRDLTRRRR